MSYEKIYYAAIVLLAAISILLSPFFYIRRPARAASKPKNKIAVWTWVIISNLIAIAALATIYLLYFA
ncbi:MAG: hypothetical protein Q4E16_06140 [Neisseria sp.]|nr:hypothetical protein [Neisseria sp.]